MWDLVPWPGLEPLPPALKLRSLSHWTTRGVLAFAFWIVFCFCPPVHDSALASWQWASWPILCALFALSCLGGALHLADPSRSDSDHWAHSRGREGRVRPLLDPFWLKKKRYKQLEDHFLLNDFSCYDQIDIIFPFPPFTLINYLNPRWK